MKLQNSENTSNRLLEFRHQLTAILSSLKTVLDRKSLNKEDTRLIVLAFQNAQDLVASMKGLLSVNQLEEDDKQILNLLKKKLDEIIVDLPLEEHKEILPIYQNIRALGSLNLMEESHLDSEITDTDQNWLYQVGQSIEEEISNFEFNAETLANKVYISRRQLDRRIKLLTGLTTSQFIRAIRMDKAQQLIKEKNSHSVKAIAFKVGIKSVSHFSKQYKAKFKISPSDDLKGV